MHLHASVRVVKLNEPFARHAVSINFRRSEHPLFCRFQRKIREIVARTGTVQIRIGNVARSIDVYLNADMHSAVNGSEGLRRRFGPDLIERFSTCT